MFEFIGKERRALKATQSLFREGQYMGVFWTLLNKIILFANLVNDL